MIGEKLQDLGTLHDQVPNSHQFFHQFLSQQPKTPLEIFPLLDIETYFVRFDSLNNADGFDDVDHPNWRLFHRLNFSDVIFVQGFQRIFGSYQCWHCLICKNDVSLPFDPPWTY